MFPVASWLSLHFSYQICMQLFFFLITCVFKNHTNGKSEKIAKKTKKKKSYNDFWTWTFWRHHQWLFGKWKYFSLFLKLPTYAFVFLCISPCSIHKKDCALQFFLLIMNLKKKKKKTASAITIFGCSTGNILAFFFPFFLLPNIRILQNNTCDTEF